MKKVLIYALFLGLIIGSTSCKGKMETINDFVTTYFPDEEVLALIKDGLDYDVTLTDYTQIGFDGNIFGKLKWDEVGRLEGDEVERLENEADGAVAHVGSLVLAEVFHQLAVEVVVARVVVVKNTQYI